MTDDAPPAPQSAIGSVKGTITLTGPPRTGVMKIGLHRQPIPAPNPPGFEKYENVVFPLAFEVQAPVGEYWLGGFLDVQNDSIRPNNGDPEIRPTIPVKLTADAVTPLDVTFGDYASTEGGATR